MKRLNLRSWHLKKLLILIILNQNMASRFSDPSGFLSWSGHLEIFPTIQSLGLNVINIKIKNRNDPSILEGISRRCQSICWLALLQPLTTNKNIYTILFIRTCKISIPGNRLSNRLNKLYLEVTLANTSNKMNSIYFPANDWVNGVDDGNSQLADKNSLSRDHFCL